MENIQDLQIVILEEPHRTLSTEEGKYYFSNMCQVKLEGYREIHGNALALPLDQYDFISSHILICDKKDNGKHQIISAYRSLSYKKCKEFGLKFDILSVVEEHAEKVCQAEVLKILDGIDSKNVDIRHNSRWTFAPEYSSNIKMKFLNLEVGSAILHYYDNYPEKNEWFSLGVNSLRTDRIFHRSGGKNVSDSPYFNLIGPYGREEKITLIHGALDRDECANLVHAIKHKELWENRIIIN